MGRIQCFAVNVHLRHSLQWNIYEKEKDSKYDIHFSREALSLFNGTVQSTNRIYRTCVVPLAAPLLLSPLLPALLLLLLLVLLREKESAKASPQSKSKIVGNM